MIRDLGKVSAVTMASALQSPLEEDGTFKNS